MDQFWETFVEKYWDKVPGVFEDVSAIDLSEDDIFEGFRRCFAKIVKSESVAGLASLYIERSTALQPDFTSFIPPDSCNLREYIALVTERLNGRRFGINIHQFHRHQPKAWGPMLEFVRPLFGRIGIPSDRVESAVFFGNYRTTPFGIHRDIGNSVFTFPVLGKKRFLAWPPGHFEQNPLSIYFHPQPSDHAEGSLVLDGAKGNMIFWPRNWMHVAHDDVDAPHAAFSVGTWSEATSNNRLLELARHSIEKMGNDTRLPAGVAMDGRVPDELLGAIAAFEKRVQDGTFRAEALESWKARIDNLGFTVLPAEVAE